MMNWIDRVLSTPKNKSEILEKLDNDGYTYPRYSRVLNAPVLAVDELSLKKDCERLGIELSEVWPRQITLF